MTNKKIGFIGLGKIGFPVALNIAKKGFELLAYDENPRMEYVDQLKGAGGRVASTIIEVVRECEVIITLLPNSLIVKKVLLSEEIKNEFTPGTICIDMTSGFPEDTKRIATELIKKEVHMLDAPICNGGVPGAYAGNLKLCVGGDRDLFESISPILSATAKEVKHVGELGMGHTIKVISNYIIFASTSVISEALAMGQASNIEPQLLVDELKSCAASQVLDFTVAQAMLNEPGPEVGFRAALATKDLGYATQMASQYSVSSPMASAAHELYSLAVQNGHGDSEAILAPWLLLKNEERVTV